MNNELEFEMMQKLELAEIKNEAERLIKPVYNDPMSNRHQIIDIPSVGMSQISQESIQPEMSNPE